MKPNKKTFQVLITTTFNDVLDVEAESENEALQIAEQMVWDGEFDTALGEPSTEYEIFQKGDFMNNQKHYCLVGWRLNRAQREECSKRGLHVYSTRSWDEGCGCTLEHRVIVNHEDDVITDFQALDPNNREDFRNDFYEYMEEVDAIDDEEFYESVKDILEMQKGEEDRVRKRSGKPLFFLRLSFWVSTVPQLIQFQWQKQKHL